MGASVLHDSSVHSCQENECIMEHVRIMLTARKSFARGGFERIRASKSERGKTGWTHYKSATLPTELYRRLFPNSIRILRAKLKPERSLYPSLLSHAQRQSARARRGRGRWRRLSGGNDFESFAGGLADRFGTSFSAFCSSAGRASLASAPSWARASQAKMTHRSFAVPQGDEKGGNVAGTNGAQRIDGDFAFIVPVQHHE